MGQWRIVVGPDPAKSFSGRAVFADGGSASGMTLHFGLQDEEGKHVWARPTTPDQEGRFSARMSVSAGVSGTAMLEEPGGGTPHRAWFTSVQGLRPRQSDVELVFENRGVIDVVVEPGNQLPEDWTFRVGCSLVDRPSGHRRTWSILADTVGATGGRVRYRPRAGKNLLVVELWHVMSWPRAQIADNDTHYVGGGLSNLARRCNDSLFIPHDVSPDETVRQDLIVPRTRLGEVRIDWLGPADVQPMGYTLLVRTGAGLISIAAPRSGSRTMREEMAPITCIPAGPRILFFRAGEYCGYQEADTAEPDTTFVFDPSSSGSVSGRVTHPDGTPAVGARVVLLHPDLVGLRGGGLDSGDVSVRAGARLGSRKAGSDGTFHFPQVTPGRYALGTASWPEPVFAPAVVREGRQTQADLTVEEPLPYWRRGAPPLREE